MNELNEQLKQEIQIIYNELKDYNTLMFDLPLNVKSLKWWSEAPLLLHH